MVLIKNVGKQEIRLSEGTSIPHSFELVAAWCTMSVLGVIFALIYLFSVGENFAVFMMLLLAPAMFGMTLLLNIDNLPEWVVSWNDQSVHIIKTTSDLDQISIRKAVKELEAKARDFDFHQTELERFAGMCK